MYDFNYIHSKGLQVTLCKIPKDKLAELMEDDKREQKRQEDLDYLEECKSDKDDWDMKEADYF